MEWKNVRGRRILWKVVDGGQNEAENSNGMPNGKPLIEGDVKSRLTTNNSQSTSLQWNREAVGWVYTPNLFTSEWKFWTNRQVTVALATNFCSFTRRFTVFHVWLRQCIHFSLIALVFELIRGFYYTGGLQQTTSIISYTRSRKSFIDLTVTVFDT